MNTTIRPTLAAPIRPQPQNPDQFTFAFPSAAPSMVDEVVWELPKEDAPPLKRPVVFVHGYCGGPGNWENMTTWLTRGGVNSYGGVVKPGDTTPLPKDGDVFHAEFSRPYNSVTTNARELREMIDRVAAATGSAEVDVVAHSMGGLDTRKYLDEGNEKVKKFVMLGTPNHGSVLADIELKFRDLGVPIFPAIKDEELRRALVDLSEDRMENGKPNNPLLHEMNRNWERQRNRAEVFTIAANGKPTLASKTLLTFRGDGLVTQKSLKMDKTPNKNLWWVGHSGLKDHPEALKATAAWLTDRPIVLTEQEPPDVPPDQEFIPTKVTANAELLDYEIVVTNERR